MERKIDKRTLRTKQAIKKVVINILLSKKEKINITNITKLSALNRNTFYLHYHSVSDVIEEIFNDISFNTLEHVKKNDIYQYILSPMLLMEVISDSILNNTLYLELIFFSDYSNVIFNNLVNAITDYLFKEYKKLLNSDNEIYEFSINFLVNGYLHCLKKWYLSAHSSDLIFVHRQISKISLYGVKETYMIESNRNK